MVIYDNLSIETSAGTCLLVLRKRYVRTKTVTDSSVVIRYPGMDGELIMSPNSLRMLINLPQPQWFVLLRMHESIHGGW